MDPSTSPVAASHAKLERTFDLATCLPGELRGPSTTITQLTAGLSGAGVYRVEANGAAYALKISRPDEPSAAWDRKRQTQQLAADAGLAPPVMHVDAAHRAVLSRFVADRSFPAFYRTPQTHEIAVTQLGDLLRRVHDLPLPAGAVATDARESLAAVLAELTSNFAVPTFVTSAVNGVLAEDAPPSDRPPVLSHNDVNPSNLVYDGTTILLLDWDTTGANDPLYDLAAIAVFLRMDDLTCAKVLAAHDRAPVSPLPVRFHYLRRLVAAFCGATLLNLARRSGRAGATGDESLESAPSLLDFYQRLRTGELSPATAAGQWYFGLALIKASAAL